MHKNAEVSLSSSHVMGSLSPYHDWSLSWIFFLYYRIVIISICLGINFGVCSALRTIYRKEELIKVLRLPWPGGGEGCIVFLGFLLQGSVAFNLKRIVLGERTATSFFYKSWSDPGRGSNPISHIMSIAMIQCVRKRNTKLQVV